MSVKIMACLSDNIVFNLTVADGEFDSSDEKVYGDLVVDVTGKEVRIGDVYNPTTKKFAKPE